MELIDNKKERKKENFSSKNSSLQTWKRHIYYNNKIQYREKKDEEYIDRT